GTSRFASCRSVSSMWIVPASVPTSTAGSWIVVAPIGTVKGQSRRHASEKWTCGLSIGFVALGVNVSRALPVKITGDGDVRVSPIDMGVKGLVGVVPTPVTDIAGIIAGLTASVQ